jgi:hypothetical protein
VNKGRTVETISKSYEIIIWCMSSSRSMRAVTLPVYQTITNIDQSCSSPRDYPCRLCASSLPWCWNVFYRTKSRGKHACNSFRVLQSACTLRYQWLSFKYPLTYKYFSANFLPPLSLVFSSDTHGSWLLQRWTLAMVFSPVIDIPLTHGGCQYPLSSFSLSARSRTRSLPTGAIFHWQVHAPCA